MNDEIPKPEKEKQDPQLALLERDIATDYFTVSGVLTLTGCKRENLGLMALNEFLGNGFDAAKNAVTLDASIVQKCSSEPLSLFIQDNGTGMDEDKIFKSYDYSKFFSTKYFYKLPQRGFLGHGVKVIGGLVYGLAREANAEIPPTQIWSQNLEYSITPTFNEETQKPDVLKEKPQPCDFPVGTKIGVKLFLQQDESERINEYYKMIREYAVFNPEANLHFSFSDGKRTLELNYPRIYNSKKRFTAGASVYWFSQADFRGLVESTDRSLKANGKDVTITQFILDQKFRGLTSDQKAGEIGHEFEDKYQVKYISQVARRPDFIKQLYEKLRESSTDPNPDCLGEIGKKAMLKRLTQIYGVIQEFKYKCVKGSDTKSGVTTPYCLEVAVAVLEWSLGRHLLTGINRGACVVNPFEGWSCTVEEGKDDVALCEGAFQKYEITRDQNVVVVIHLISPHVEYENKGKGKVDINPFATDLAVALTQVCRFYPAYKIRGVRVGRQSRARQYLNEELLRRKKLFDTLGEVPLSERATQQSLYYKVRNKMGGRIDVKRKSFIQAISDLCAEIGDEPSYRDKLGIVAAERAQLYFRGHCFPISIENIEELATKGCDVILIEKEGVCEVLVMFADGKGVALINSRGFASDYAKQLLQIARRTKGHIWLITDLDDSGLVMFQNTLKGEIPRLGVDSQMLDALKINREAVEEKYKPSDKHFKSLPLGMQEQVKHTRVEIDAVLAAVGPENFWNYIQQQIQTLAPTRDLNRSIDLTVRLPSEIAEHISIITGFIQSIASLKQKEIRESLKEWKGGLVDVEEKEEEFHSLMCNEMLKNTQVQEVAKQLKGLTEKIPKTPKTQFEIGLVNSNAEKSIFGKTDDQEEPESATIEKQEESARIINVLEQQLEKQEAKFQCEGCIHVTEPCPIEAKPNCTFFHKLGSPFLGNVNNNIPDLELFIPTEGRRQISELSSKGTSIREIAAEYKITEEHVTRILAEIMVKKSDGTENPYEADEEGNSDSGEDGSTNQ
jgi:DNA topoisomerase VI subunit B